MPLRPLSWLHRSSEHAIRTSTEQDILLARAAGIAGLPLDEFILQAACRAAELTVLDQRQFFVSGLERQQLIALQQALPEPAPALCRLLTCRPPWLDCAELTPPQPLSPAHALHQFDCAQRAMNEWLAYRSLHAQIKGSAKTFVIATGTQVVAYFSLSVGQIDSCELPGHGGAIVDRDAFPVPVIMLTRLAVDSRYQGRGFGSALLGEVLRHTLTVADSAGVEALLTQPLNEKAANFYMANGFVQSPAAYKQLLLTIGDIQAAQACVGAGRPPATG